MAQTAEEHLANVAEKMVKYGVVSRPVGAIADPVLGLPLAEWVYRDRQYRLYTGGISGGWPSPLVFDHVDEVFPMLLREVMKRTTSPEAESPIGFLSKGDRVDLLVPMKIYTYLCPALAAVCGSTRRFHA